MKNITFHFTKPSFSFYSLQCVKPALRQTEAEDNSQHDGTCHLDGFHAIVGELRHIVHDEIVGRIVNTCSGNQRKNTGDEVNGYRISADRGQNTRKYGECEGGSQIRKHRAHIAV